MEKSEKLLSEKEYKRFEELMQKLATGKIKKWTLPNDSEVFDPNVAFENFKFITKSDLPKEHLKKMKEIYGER